MALTHSGKALIEISRTSSIEIPAPLCGIAKEMAQSFRRISLR
jgi:hypothetical protein